MRRLVFAQIILLCVWAESAVFAETFSVNNTTEFEDTLLAIENNDDNDNTIIATGNLSIDDSFSWPAKDKRIAIQTSGNAALTFETTTAVPPNVKLVVDSANVIFEDGFIVDRNIEIHNSTATPTNASAENLAIDAGQLKVTGNQTALASTGDITVDDGELIVSGGARVTADNIALGGTTPEGTLLVTGPGSELLVNNPDVTPATLTAGAGTIHVTDDAWISMTGTGQIALDGNVLFDNARLNQTTGTMLDAGSGMIAFDHGSVVRSAGTLNALGGVFVNDDSALNVAGTNGILNVTGGGVYFSDRSTLGISLDAAGNAGKIDAADQIVAIDGHLLVTPEYGYYGTTPITSTIVESTGNISGAFDSVRLTNDRLGTLVVVYSGIPGTVGLTFNPRLTPYSDITQTRNERSVGQTFDAIHRQQLANFAPLMQATWDMSDAQLRSLYNDLSGEIRAHTMAMPLANPGRMVFDRVGWDSSSGHVFFGPQYRLAASGSRRATWLRPYYVGDRVKSDGNASRYTLDGYGFVGGIDQTLVGGKSAVGLMLGYGRPELETRNDKAELDDFIIGGYFATRVADAFEVKLWGGYGYQYYDMHRHIDYLGTRQSLKSNFKGHTGTFSADLTRPIYMLIPGIPRLVLKPTVGYDYTYLKQKAGDETGNHLIALAYDKTDIERHIGRIGVNFEFGDSARSLYGGAHYKYLLGGDDVYYSQASFIGGGPSFVVESVDLGKSFVSANIGMQFNLSGDPYDRGRMLFIDYNVDFGDHDSRYQTATFGIQQIF